MPGGRINGGMAEFGGGVDGGLGAPNEPGGRSGRCSSAVTPGGASGTKCVRSIDIIVAPAEGSIGAAGLVDAFGGGGGKITGPPFMNWLTMFIALSVMPEGAKIGTGNEGTDVNGARGLGGTSTGLVCGTVFGNGAFFGCVVLPLCSQSI